MKLPRLQPTKRRSPTWSKPPVSGALESQDPTGLSSDLSINRRRSTRMLRSSRSLAIKRLPKPLNIRRRKRIRNLALQQHSLNPSVLATKPCVLSSRQSLMSPHRTLKVVPCKTPWQHSLNLAVISLPRSTLRSTKKKPFSSSFTAVRRRFKSSRQ